VTINDDLELLRKMFALGIRDRLLNATPFRVAGENVIHLDPESPREAQLTDPEAERKLFRGHRNLSATSVISTRRAVGSVFALLRVEQARAQAEGLANPCKDSGIAAARRRRRSVVRDEQVTAS
jgi:hypothetical protein